MSRAKGPNYQIPFRRRREGKTNYRKRLALLKSRLPRLVVRKLNRRIIVQIIEYGENGDRVLVHVSSEHLRKFGWPARANTPTAYLAGLLAGKMAKKKGINKVILDLGLHTPKKDSFAYFAFKGVLDAGLQGPANFELTEGRERGEHIAEYAKKLKDENESEYQRRFSSYLKEGVKPEDLPKLFDEVRKKIAG